MGVVVEAFADSVAMGPHSGKRSGQVLLTPLQSWNSAFWGVSLCKAGNIANRWLKFRKRLANEFWMWG